MQKFTLVTLLHHTSGTRTLLGLICQGGVVSLQHLDPGDPLSWQFWVIVSIDMAPNSFNI